MIIFSFYKNSSNNALSIDLNDVFTNVNFSELYTAFGCTASGCHGTISGGNGQYYYTPNSGFVGINTLQYTYSLGGNPVAMDEPFYYIYINVIDTSTSVDTTTNTDTTYNIFNSNFTLDVCTEDIQGRLTWTLNYSDTAVSIFDITQATLLVPTASPSNVIDNSVSGASGMLTPNSSGMRTEIADISTTNYIIISAEFNHNGTPQIFDLYFLLPHFSQSANTCETLSLDHATNMLE